MQDAIFKFAVRIILEAVKKWLTPEKIDEGKVLLVAFLRRLAKEQSPGFPFDDELVEIIAKALGVPA